jgi:membrane-bound lytic murein transglycosylase B
MESFPEAEASFFMNPESEAKKNMERTRTRKLLCAAILSLAAALVWTGGDSARSSIAEPFSQVKRILLQQGVEQSVIHKAYNPPPELKLDTVSRFIRIREGELDYDQYLQQSSLGMAEQFLKEHRRVLQRVERQYSVDRYTIAAILLVETRIGRYTGSTRALDILSTLALLEQQAYRDRVWDMLPAQDRRKLERPSTSKRLQRKADRARKDLIALFEWYRERPEDLASLQGSIMGAVGWPQFLPSSAMAYGVDGNGDGRLDLFDPADAVFSVANYLQSAGWEPSSSSAQEKAILRYNRSRPYMRTVLEIAARLRRS